jgi:hypothetical protein
VKSSQRRAQSKGLAMSEKTAGKQLLHYFIVHLHRLLDPESASQPQSK